MSQPGNFPPPPLSPDYTTYGAPQYPGSQDFPGAQQFPGRQYAPQFGAAPQKSFLTTWLFALFLGGLGVDRFYLGKIGTGIAKLLTGGGLGIWALVDLVITLAGKQTDKNARPLAGYAQHKALAIAVSAVLVLGSMIIGAVSGAVAALAIQSAATSPIISAAPLTDEPAASDPSGSAAPSASGEAAAGQDRPHVVAQSFAGTGDDVKTVDLKGMPALVTFTCKACSGNTVLGTNGAEIMLVNTIGGYTGSHLVDTNTGSATSEFTISADAAWTLKVEDLDAVPTDTGKASGHGDKVIYWDAPSDKAAITNKGKGQFLVEGFGNDVPELPVDDEGAYSGTVQLTPGFVQIKSEGDWTITAK
jgi:TM2 domain-containing membrane protein YozV